MGSTESFSAMSDTDVDRLVNLMARKIKEDTEASAPPVVEPRKFLWLSIEDWVKIVVGGLIAMLVGFAGWFLHIRDSLVKRPTIEVMDKKIYDSYRPVVDRADKQELKIEKHAEEVRKKLEKHTGKIHGIELWQANHAAVEEAQAKQMEEQKKTLRTIQGDIKKLLQR